MITFTENVKKKPKQYSRANRYIQQHKYKNIHTNFGILINSESSKLDKKASRERPIFKNKGGRWTKFSINLKNRCKGSG